MTWSVPPCPFSIEWSPDAMERIRVDAMEALFSLPHGGAEIGGVLLGTHGQGRVNILEVRPLECEHALAPSFTLSAKDANAQPLGWYHAYRAATVRARLRSVALCLRQLTEPRP